MTELLHEWITGITCISILLTAAQCLMPEGSVRKVGSLAGGLLLLLALIMPLKSLETKDLSLALAEYRLMGTDSVELLELENERLVKTIIEEQTTAYILDKAEAVGIKCSAEVSYEYSDNGIAYPVEVTIFGDLTKEQKRKLMQIIENDLAVSKENQFYKKGEES